METICCWRMWYGIDAKGQLGGEMQARTRAMDWPWRPRPRLPPESEARSQAGAM